MKFTFFSVALRNLKRKQFRTAVLIISISLLVSIIVFGVSFVVSVSSSIERATARLGADLLVVPLGARDLAEEVLLETKSKEFYMDASIVERVRAIEGVKEASAQVYLTTIMGVCCDIPETMVVAFDQETDFIIKPWLNKSIGRKLKKNEIIIGSVAYENFDLLDVERSVFFNMVFDIAGVLEPTGTGLDNAMLMSDENLEEIIAGADVGVKPNQVSVIFTRIHDGEIPEKVGNRVENAIVEADVTTRSNMGKRIISNLKDINMMFIITISLASLLSAFLAWSVFSAIASERLKEIGIMRAIGAMSSDVIWMFTLEVLVLGFMGSVIGIAIGTYLYVGLADSFTLIREMPVAITQTQRISIAVMGLVFGTGICFLGALSTILRLRSFEPFNAIKEV